MVTLKLCDGKISCHWMNIMHALIDIISLKRKSLRISVWKNIYACLTVNFRVKYQYFSTTFTPIYPHLKHISLTLLRYPFLLYWGFSSLKWTFWNRFIALSKGIYFRQNPDNDIKSYKLSGLFKNITTGREQPFGSGRL